MLHRGTAVLLLIIQSVFNRCLSAVTQAGVLSGDVQNIVLLDVTPLSLGLETLGEWDIHTELLPMATWF